MAIDRADDDNSPRVVIYDPEDGAPEARPGTTFYIPHNNRDPSGSDAP